MDEIKEWKRTQWKMNLKHFEKYSELHWNEIMNQIMATICGAIFRGKTIILTPEMMVFLRSTIFIQCQMTLDDEVDDQDSVSDSDSNSDSDPVFLP